MENIIFVITFLTCHETGKQFLAEREGCSVTYAKDAKGNIYSNEGVYIGLKRTVKQDSILYAYVDNSQKVIQGWKTEHILGKIIYHYVRNNGFCGKMDHVEVRMFDGSLWKGKYKSDSMQCITLRKVKVK